MEGEKTKNKTIVIDAMETGPGPGRYFLPSTCGFMNHDYTRQKTPAFSFGHRISDATENYRKNCSPGPIYCVSAEMTRLGKDGTPRYSILGRQKDLNTFKTPAPGCYSPEKVHPQGERHAPVYSMSTRTRNRRRDTNPAPNRYQLPPLLGSKQPNKLSYPSYSMTCRNTIGNYGEDLCNAPGPGQHSSVKLNSFCHKQPEYSIQGRSYMPGDNTIKPGPGQHYPEMVNVNKPTPPKFSLGIRHSEFVVPLILDL